MPSVELGALSETKALKRSWIYLKQGEALTLLRSDDDGLLWKSSSSDERPELKTFDRAFTIDVPATVRVAYSRGGFPISKTILNDTPTAFTEVKLEVKPENMAPLPAVPMAANQIHVVTAAPALKMDLPPLPVVFDVPVTLEVWPYFASPFTPEYETSGLLQGAALWDADGNLTVRDGSAAVAAPIANRPKDLGAVVRGRVTNHAKQVDLFLLNPKGERLKFRPTAAADAVAVDKLTVDVVNHEGKDEFKTLLFVDDPTKFFGLVQLIAVTKQGSLDGLGDVVAALLGVQLGMCDDALAADKGDVPGICTKPPEINVVDFVVTAIHGPLPAKKVKKGSAKSIAAAAAARTALAPHSRARRMVSFEIKASRKRPRPGIPGGQLLPEMPLWMVELQFVGWRRDEGEQWLRLRRDQLGDNKRALVLSADFSLTLAWRGPDADLPGPRRNRRVRNPYAQWTQTFRGAFRAQTPASSSGEAAAPQPPVFKPAPTLVAKIDLGDDGNLRIDANGKSAVAAEPAYAAVSFPTPDRRVPGVWLDKRPCTWGWRASGTAISALVVEWQPAIGELDRRNFKEIMLGGNGSLLVENLLANDVALARPKPADTGAGGSAHSPAPTSLSLPTFRIKGTSPARSERQAIVDRALHEVYAAHRGSGPTTMLSETVWKALATRLTFRESGGQHFGPAVERKVFTERTPYQCHGLQSGMPLFGAPAGYGLGQHDPPRKSPQDMWSFYEHICNGVEMLLVTDFGGPAYRYLTHLHALDPSRPLDRAIYLRQVVRQYNGGNEFVYEGGHWKMRPFVAKKGHVVLLSGSRLEYANGVLGTSISYAGPPEGTSTLRESNWTIADIAGGSLAAML